jgi:hypothetical protein
VPDISNTSAPATAMTSGERRGSLVGLSVFMPLLRKGFELAWMFPGSPVGVGDDRSVLALNDPDQEYSS